MLWRKLGLRPPVTASDPQLTDCSGNCAQICITAALLCEISESRSRKRRNTQERLWCWVVVGRRRGICARDQADVVTARPLAQIPFFFQ